jgi:hypothetical protein
MVFVLYNVYIFITHVYTYKHTYTYIYIKTRNYNKYGHLIKETQWVLRCLQQWKITHVRRLANETAHRLANEALFLNEEWVVVEDILHYIVDVIFVERYA